MDEFTSIALISALGIGAATFGSKGQYVVAGLLLIGALAVAYRLTHQGD